MNGADRRLLRVIRPRVLGSILSVAVLLSTPIEAQDTLSLAAEFDARSLKPEEKRTLQLGLALDQHYTGLIDGRWGEASQQALERFAATIDDDYSVGGLVRNHHVFYVALQSGTFIADNKLFYRGGPPYGHRLLTPEGQFVENPETRIDDLVLRSDNVEISTWIDWDEAGLRHVHDRIAVEVRSAEEPYTVRRKDRLVTRGREFGGRYYFRSDKASSGIWYSTLIREIRPGDRRLFDVLIAGITTDADAGLVLDEEDPLMGLVVEALGVLGAPEGGSGGDAGAVLVPPPASGGATTRSLPTSEAPEPSGGSSGTAFFVNNSDLVTAAHVIEGCDRPTFTDGTELSVVARHPTLDLALLSSPQRSRDWIPVHDTGAARLGQSVNVLGYPYFGTFSTALSLTTGNVSALSGLNDDLREITISAPVQPGNSGGPVLSSEGLVIGVVVSRLDAIAVAQHTGTIPENINYAVTGSELLAFLKNEGASLPQGGAPAVLEDGIPDEFQRAVVPILCPPGQGDRSRL